MNKNYIVNFLIVLVSIFFSLIILEIILNIKFTFNPIKNSNSKLDKRSVYEVYKTEVNKGNKIYPWMGPAVLFNIDKFLPLSGISNSQTIFCNETGDWKIYESDRYGFNNNNSNYDKRIEVLIIGDSFAEGSCVDYENSFQGYFSRKGYNSISLGKGGNDALLSFAILKEYIKIIKPKKIIWFHYVNDIEDTRALLKDDNKKKIILKYLNNKDYNQNLFDRQNEVDEYLIKSLNEYVPNLERRYHGKLSFRYSKFVKILSLYNLRQLINSNFEIIEIDMYENELKFFSIALKETIKLVKKNDTKFLFVYLPWQNRYTIGREHHLKRNVLNEVNILGVNLLDIHPVFWNTENPLKYYNYNNVHFNKDGFKLISEEIIKNFLSN